MLKFKIHYVNYQPKARASPRGGVRRKLAANLRADVQKPHIKAESCGEQAQHCEAHCGSRDNGK
jgi:hypothetical protein